MRPRKKIPASAPYPMDGRGWMMKERRTTPSFVRGSGTWYLGKSEPRILDLSQRL